MKSVDSEKHRLLTVTEERESTDGTDSHRFALAYLCSSVKSVDSEKLSTVLRVCAVLKWKGDPPMATTNDVRWQVLLDDDAWENLSPPDAPAADERKHTPAPRPAHLWRGLILSLFLLLLAPLVVWRAEASRPARTAAAHPAPAGADRLAAQSRAVILTEHLRIYAAGADVATVQANADALESLYREIYAAFGLPVEAESSAPDGRLSLLLGGARDVAWQRGGGRVSLPSPAHLGGNGAWTEADLLRQGWTVALVERVIWQAGDRHRIPAGWLPLLKGAQLWLLWDGGPLAEGKEEIVAWLHTQERRHLPEARAQELCRLYALWGRSPLDFSIPIGCTPAQRAIFFAPATPDRLSALGLPEDENDPEAYSRLWTGQTSNVALALLIQYAAEAHGRDTIPALLAALKGHTSWRTLIPAVFGLPAAEFEAGWQAWLVAKYGGLG